MSKLRVNDILPANGLNIGIGTAGATINVTATNTTFSGNVSVGGTLTYDDVTNIDSVGVVTARSGIRVTDGSIGIGTDVTPTTKLQIGAGTADLNNVIKFGKRTPTTQSNLPLIGHYSHNGEASGLGLCATSSSGSIHFFTGNNASGFDVGINSERMRIHHDGVIQTFNHAECQAYHNGVIITGGDASTHTMGFQHFRFNRGGYTINGSGRIVLPKTGAYRALVTMESRISASAYSIRAMKTRVRVNGVNQSPATGYDQWHSVAAGPSSNTHWTFHDQYYFEASSSNTVDIFFQWYPYASRTETMYPAISLFYIG
jgi:hypothetical protein